jgi:hypothetical protein
MFQIQIYIIVVFILSGGAVSVGLEKVWEQAEFIADIYRQFPQGCIMIVNPETQQQSEYKFYIIYIRFVCLVRNVLTETWDGEFYVLCV